MGQYNMITELTAGYSVEVDTVSRESWDRIIEKFDDANIYQMWSYETVRSGQRNLSHLLLKKGEEVVAAAQARIATLPFINIGVAYIRWGPLWRTQTTNSIEVFFQAVRALRNEYTCRRGLVLRILPVLFNDDADTFLPAFKSEGFTWLERARRERTLIIDLMPSLEDLRKGLEQKWRNCLNRAEKNNLEVIEAYDDQLFDMFVTIYKNMINRKKFMETSDVNQFRLIQKELPADFKMKVFICRSDEGLCSGAICSAIGKTGVYLFGATSDVGMKSKGSYLLQWKIIEWLKEKKCSYYDLHGINPVINPGTYNFKAGLCGRNGKDVLFLGQFDAYQNIASLLTVKCIDFIREKYRKMIN
jgi:lipid II:glycine glycyltransferase (peptidoglycan interpeptide bridge formation enzyme)